MTREPTQHEIEEMVTRMNDITDLDDYEDWANEARAAWQYVAEKLAEDENGNDEATGHEFDSRLTDVEAFTKSHEEQIQKLEARLQILENVFQGYPYPTYSPYPYYPYRNVRYSRRLNAGLE